MAHDETDPIDADAPTCLLVRCGVGPCAIETHARDDPILRVPRRPQSAVGEATSGFLEIPLAVPHRDIDVVQVEMGHCQVIAEDRRVRDDVVDGPHLRHA